MMTSEKAPSMRRSALKDAAAVAVGLRQQVQDDFAVDGGLKNGALRFEFVPQDGGVDEVAVVGDGDLAARAIDDERLGVARWCSNRWWNSACGRWRMCLSDRAEFVR